MQDTIVPQAPASLPDETVDAIDGNPLMDGIALQQHAMAVRFLVAICLYSVGATTLIGAVHPEYFFHGVAINAATVAWLLIGAYVSRRRGRGIARFVYVSQIFMAGGMALMMSATRVIAPDLAGLDLFSLQYTQVMLVPLVFYFCPYMDRRCFLAMIPCCAAALFVAILSGLHVIAVATMVLVALLVGYLRADMHATQRKLWQLERRDRESAARDERAKHHYELRLASELQDSVELPACLTLPGNMVVRTMQDKHDIVGGDWLAMRSEVDALYVLSIDATGKGVQAGLIVHAIQALWLDAFESSVFEPKAWVERVHRNLRRLSAKTLHTATLGLLKVTRDEYEYWSAGHLPLVVFADGQVRAQRRFAQGGMLGLDEDLALRPFRERVQGDRLSLFLGSDGMFEPSLRASLSALSALHADPQGDFSVIQSMSRSRDDRSLAWVYLDKSPQAIKLAS
jgi:hypothetical protein